MKGYIHSVETFGTVDGPGIRFVVFFQGCPLRCLYCHNPDSQEFSVGEVKTVDEILDNYDCYRTFYKNGGITATGGEPLMQLPFLTELFRAAKKRGIHTCLDTSGVTFHEDPLYLSDLNTLLQFVDMVMLDIKHIDNKKHIKLTGVPNDNILAFAKYLSSLPLTLLIRHVLVPSYTDDAEDLAKLGAFLKTLVNPPLLDVLPYHNLAIPKYEKLSLDYPLKDIPPLNKEDAALAKAIILNAMQ